MKVVLDQESETESTFPSTDEQTRTRRVQEVISLAVGLLAITFAFFMLRNCSIDVRLWPVMPNSKYEYAFFLSTSIALSATYFALSRRIGEPRVLDFPWVIVLLAILSGVAVYRFGMHQFGGWDEGLIAHVASQYAQGAKPYASFPCSMPPFFMAGIRLAIRLFGFRWASFALLPALYSSITTIWSFAALKSAKLDGGWALVIALAIQLAIFFASPFWWFNNLSAMAVVLVFLSVLVCLKPCKTLLPWIGLALALCFVLTSKPNVLPACIAILPLLITKSRQQLAKTIGAIALALLLSGAVCFYAQMPLAPLLRSYAEIAKLRGSPFAAFPISQLGQPERNIEIFSILIMCVSFIAPLLACAVRELHHWRYLFVAAVGALTSIEMVLTNSDLLCVNLIALLVVMALVVLRPWSSWRPSLAGKALLTALLALVSVAGAYAGLTHKRIINIGPNMYYQPVETRTIQSGFFAGLESGPILWNVMNETQTALSMYRPQRVFFGPRLEFEYAVFSRKVQPGMPLLWDPGNLFPKDRMPELVSQFRRNNPDMLIFLKDDYSRMNEMAEYIAYSGEYTQVQEFPLLTIYLRNYPY